MDCKSSKECTRTASPRERIANKEGLDVGFTRPDGTKINASSPEFKDIGAEKFMNMVKDQTNAMSIQNDMKPLDPGETPQSGDMTNNGVYVNVVRGLDTENQESISSDAVPTASGSLPPRKPENSSVGKDANFKEFKVIDNAVKKDTQEGIRLMNEAGGVQEGG